MNGSADLQLDDLVLGRPHLGLQPDHCVGGKKRRRPGKGASEGTAPKAGAAAAGTARAGRRAQGGERSLEHAP